MSENVSGNVFHDLRNGLGRTFFVAEAGLNHGGSREKALAMVRAAKWVGADAIAFDAFKANRLNDANLNDLLQSADPSLRESLERFELDFDVLRSLHKEAVRLEIAFLSTPFDGESANFLEELDLCAIKIPPGDSTHGPSVKNIAQKGKPVLVSTQMSTAEQIEDAIDWIHTQANQQIILIHSVSSDLPTREETNLKSIKFLLDRFGLPVGFSDQSPSNLGAIVAVSLGAQVIERHFMLETRGDLPHREVSFDTKRLRAHVEELRAIERILGARDQFAARKESQSITTFQPALYAKRPIARGETISRDMLYTPKYAVGIPPEHVEHVVGRAALNSIDEDEPVQWNAIA